MFFVVASGWFDVVQLAGQRLYGFPTDFHRFVQQFGRETVTPVANQRSHHRPVRTQRRSVGRDDDAAADKVRVILGPDRGNGYAIGRREKCRYDVRIGEKRRYFENRHRFVISTGFRLIQSVPTILQRRSNACGYTHQWFSK